MPSPRPLPEPIWQTVVLLAHDSQVWLVGGAVRDHLLRRTTLDADFAVAGDARRLARKVADKFGADYYELDRERGSGRVLLDRAGSEAWILDFAAVRGEDIDEDLRARDFTVNALAIDLVQPDVLIDPTGGLSDLKSRLLRACSDRAVADDPVRSLRAVRLAADLGFRIETGTLRQVEAAAPAVGRISAERVRDEVFRMLGGANPAGALRTLDRVGLLAEVLPEVTDLRGVLQPSPHAFDAFEHSLGVLEHMTRLTAVLGLTHDPEAASRMTLAEVSLKLGRFRAGLERHLDSSLTPGRQVRQLLFLAAVCHDIGKARTSSVSDEGRIGFSGHEELGANLIQARGRHLKLSSQEVDRLATIVRFHHVPALIDRSGEPTRRAIYRFFDQTGEAGIDIALVSLADRLGMYVPPIPQETWKRRVDVARSLLEAHFEGDWLNPPRLLAGDELGEILEVEPGPELGRLLAAIREAQAVGEVHTRAQAIALARGLHDGSIRPVTSEGEGSLSPEP